MHHVTPAFIAAALGLLASLTLACSSDSKSMRSGALPRNHHADAVPATSEEATPSPTNAVVNTVPNDAIHTPAATGGTGSTAGTGSEGTALTSDAPSVGIRNFRQINDAMAALTGVPRTTATVAAAFATLQTQLPDTNDIRNFSGSHQVAVSKLAVEYCDAMIESATLSAAAIPGFNFAATPSVAFDAKGKDLVAKALLAKFWGTGLASNPNEAETTATLTALLDDVVAGKANTAQITKNAIKGLCTALLSTGQVLFL